MMNVDDYGPVWQTAVLDRLPVKVQRSLSPQMMQDAGWSRHEDRERDRMVMELRSHVLAHKLAVESRTATASGVKDIEVPRFPWWLFFLALTALMVLSAVTASALGWLASMALAGLAVWAYACPSSDTERLEMTVTATVPDALYATFPDSSVSYPDTLGPVVPVVMSGQTVYDASMN